MSEPMSDFGTPKERIAAIIAAIKQRDKALTIIVGNQKGGVGKTSNTNLIAYTLATWGVNTLVGDLDPQANATKSLMLTKLNHSDHETTIDKSLMRGVQEHDLTDLPIEIMPNLSLLPSYIDFQGFTKYLYRHSKNDYEETHILAPLFEPLKTKYDIILLDMPPLNVETTRNAVIFSDYVLISLQTQDDSLSGAEEYVNTLVKMRETYDLSIEVIGVLPVLNDKRGSVDQLILNTATEEFGEDAMFKTVIPQMQRIKRFPINGITDQDRYDSKVHRKYWAVTDELLNHIAEFEAY